MKRVKLINDPAELVALFRAVDSEVRRNVLSTLAEGWTMISELNEKLGNLELPEIVLFPPFMWLTEAKKMLKDTELILGAQNVYWETDGPFTGEINSHMLVDIVDYVLIGHSERRLHFGEEDSEINKNGTLGDLGGIRGGIFDILNASDIRSVSGWEKSWHLRGHF